ncbi:MAG: hypothetical protein K1X57_20005 [Gemmataceae bacterium]|nr:hypothetical protein [Gemmataceae bacterium]
MPGIIDNLIDRKVEAQLRERLSVAHFRVALEELFAFGNRKTDGTAWEPIFDRIEDTLRTHAPDIADLLSRTSLALALGESQHTPAVFGATAPGGEQRIACRRIVRVRLINHLRKEKGCSRSVARKAVDSLTERQIDEACGTPPAAGPGDWLATLWQYITDHWPQILAALLPLLLMLI